MIKSSSQQNLELALKLVLFCVLVYFPIFLHLDKLPIRIWDEARLALSAYEMNENGNFLVPYFKGEPDMWSTKPPVMIWLQVFFIKVIGVGVLAIRLPSAIAAFLTTLIVLVFSMKYLKSYWFGLIASLVLVTSYGYIEEHAIRTGDYDSLLTFLTTSFLICFFLFMEERKLKYLHFFYALLTLAILTKSVQGLIFLPSIIIYILIQRNWGILKNKWLYIDFGVCFLIVFAYYFSREILTPGYYEAVWFNELGGRYLEPLQELHKHDFDFYFNMLKDHHYKEWIILVPFGILIGLLHRDSKVSRMTLFFSLAAIFYFLIISKSETKLQWYEVPLFPLLGILVAILLFFAFNFLKNSFYLKEELRFNILPFLFLLVVFFAPYQKTFNRVYFPEEYSWSIDLYSMGQFLHDAVDEDFSLENHYIAYEGYNAHLFFYTQILNDRNKNVSIVEDFSSFKAGNKVSASQPSVLKDLENRYELELLNEREGVKSLLIKGKKE